MSDRKKFMVSGGRAVTGLAITAAAAAGAFLIGTVELPSLDRSTHALTVSTQQTGERQLVCAGPFGELGADPARPDIAVPVGSPNVFVAGDGELGTLAVNELDDSSISGVGVVTGLIEDPVAAAQTQQLSSSTLRGFVSASCVEPVNEQWLIGGGSAANETTTLVLGNTNDVAATVQISVFDENGEIDALQTTGVIVSPKSAQIVSLNGYAPTSERIAARVTSTGAPVAASLGVTKVDGITPMGAATVTRQLRADTRLVIPGITNADVSNHDSPASSGGRDRFPVRVQAITPGKTAGTAYVAAVDHNGNRTELGTIALEPQKLGQLEVLAWPVDATAIIIDADVPVFGVAEGTANSANAQGTDRDFGWFTPAPVIEADVETPTPVAPGGTLIVANPGATSAEITVTNPGAGDADSVVVIVPAGAAMPVEMKGNVTLTASAPVHAGVRFLTGGAISGYPVLPSSDNAGELTVFTR